MTDHEPILLEYRPQRRLLGGHRDVLVPADPGAPGLPRRWARRREPGQRRSPWTVVVPLVAAVLLGLAAGLAPVPVAGVVVAGGVAAGLLLRLEWAAVVVVAASVFEDYIAQVEPRVTKVLALVLAVSWVIWRCSGRKRPMAPSPVLVAALVFTVVILLATAVHNNGDAGQAVVLRYAGFLVVLLVLADALRDRLTPRRLARVYVAACAAASLCGIATFALGDDRRVGGPIGDPNDLAFFLLPAVALGPAVRGSGPRRRFWDVATVVVVVAIAGTLSRGALVGLTGMLVVALVTGMVRARVLAGLLAAVAVAVVVVVTIVPSLVSTSLQQKGAVADQNVSERLDLWSAAARMTIDHPVLGMGPGAFSVEHQLFTTGLPDDVNHPLDVAHNTWLEVSSELGLVGLVSFVAILVVAFAEAWRGWRRRGDPVGAAVCAGLVGTALAASFVTEQYYLPFWLLAALAVGVAHRGTVR